ncbi:MAG: hypothetical protein U0T81_10525 [Saprospiraceae bacterium]
MIANVSKPDNASKPAKEEAASPTGCNPPYPTVVNVCTRKRKKLRKNFQRITVAYSERPSRR